MQKSFSQKQPTLFIVSTPIGNLGDMTYRAVETLKSVGMIFAEDTRTSKVLLNHFDIKTPYQSYHEHNKFEKIDVVLKCLNEGMDIALISDAGTPLISDPGNDLVQRVIEQGYYVVAIPGASALLASLVASGMQAQPFMFIGFLPKKQKALTLELEKLKLLETTLIFYESPHRMKDTVRTMYDVFNNRNISIMRELTKTFETIIRTTLKDIQTHTFDLRGEYTIVLEGYQQENIQMSVEDCYDSLIKTGLDTKEAMKQTALKLGISKREVYQKIKIENT